MKFAVRIAAVIVMSALLVSSVLQERPALASHKPLRRNAILRRHKMLRLAFVCSNASDYWTLARKGTEAAMKELPGVKVEFKMPGDATVDEQKQTVDSLLARGTDGIAISPIDPFNQVQMLNAAATKTLLFTQDIDVPASQRVCYVGTDDHAAGLQAGGELKKALPHGGKIILFAGTLDAQNVKDRSQGIRDALKGSAVKIIDMLTDVTDHTKAKANAATALIEHPDIAGLVGLWSYNGPAILSAVKDAGKVGKVKIVCFDEEPDTLEGIQSGAIAATIVQQPYEYGYQSIKLMAQYLRGDKAIIPVNRRVFVPTRIINIHNVQAFEAQQERQREQ